MLTRKHKRVSVGARLDSRSVKGGRARQRDPSVRSRTVQVCLGIGESPPSTPFGWRMGCGVGGGGMGRDEARREGWAQIIVHAKVCRFCF